MLTHEAVLLVFTIIFDSPDTLAQDSVSVSC